MHEIRLPVCPHEEGRPRYSGASLGHTGAQAYILSRARLHTFRHGLHGEPALAQEGHVTQATVAVCPQFAQRDVSV